MVCSGYVLSGFFIRYVRQRQWINEMMQKKDFIFRKYITRVQGDDVWPIYEFLEYITPFICCKIENILGCFDFSISKNLHLNWLYGKRTNEKLYLAYRPTIFPTTSHASFLLIDFTPNVEGREAQAAQKSILYGSYRENYLKLI